jgi:serine/threonine-protein kinase
MARARKARSRSLLRELRQRRVFQSTGVYVVATFAALQGASILVPALHLPDWTMTFLVVLAIVGLPVTAGLSWVFDLAPGPTLERTEGDVAHAGASARAAHDARTPAAASTAGHAATAAALPAAAATRSVAVMPFLNLGADPDNEFFADGITEDVIAHLSKVRDLKVISRTSVMPFKKRERSLREIGATLGAGTLLDGSVRRVGDRVRIVAQLVDARSEQQLWAETYDRRLTDIFSIQTDVALHIAAALQAELSLDEQDRIRREPTKNVEAYQHYMKGRHWFVQFTPHSMQRAIDYFGRALAADPEFALAHVGIAMAYAELVEGGAMPADVGRPRAMRAAEEALRLDPRLGATHCTIAHLTSLWEFDWAAAEAGFRRAIALCPNGADAYDLYGRMFSALGRFDEALALQRRAQELDPLVHRVDVATTLLRAGHLAEAEAESRRAVEFDPGQARAHATLGWAVLKQGRFAEGLGSLEHAVTLAPDNTQWLAQLGQACALAGDERGARAILQRLESRALTEYIAPYHLAYIHTGLGEYERAMDLLERAYEERAGAIYAIGGSFLFAPLRGHARYQALLERLKLPA